MNEHRGIWFCLIWAYLASLLVSGCALENTRSDDPALIYLERIKQNPGDVLAHGALGDIYFTRYKKNQSRKLRNKAIGEYQAFLKIQKNHLRASRVLYLLLMEKAIDEGSQQIFEQLEALYFNTPGLKEAGVGPPALVEVFMINKSTMGRVKKEDAIVAALKRAIRQAPEVVSSHVLLGKIYKRQGKISLAVTLLEQASRLSPDNPDVNRLLGELYSDRAHGHECLIDGREAAQSAIRAYKKLILSLPDEAVVHSGLADMYKLVGRKQLYEFETRRAMKLQLSTDTRWDYAHALVWNRRPEQAKKLYETLLGIEFRNPGILEEYSLLYFMLRDWKKAEYFWLESVKYASDSYFYGQVRYYLVLYKLQRGEEAERYLKGSLETSQMKGWEKEIYHYMLGDISGSQLLGRATNLCQETEAEFYIGLKADAENDLEKARKHYRRVTSLGVVSFIEHLSAVYFLDAADFGTNESVGAIRQLH